MKKLYYNGNIVTMAKEGEYVEALLAIDDKIEKTGRLEEIRQAYEDAELVDLQGKTLMPGFVDGHSHFLLAMQTAGMADLSQCSSFEEIVETMKTYIEKNHIPETGAAMGWGYDHNFLPGGKHPDRKILDQISESVPVCVVNTSGHMGCMNSPALKAAGIGADTPDPQGGKIGRIEGTSQPDGYLEEAAMFQGMGTVAARLGKAAMPSISAAENLYLSNGVTTVQDGGATRQTVESLLGFDQGGQLHVDVVVYLMMEEEGRKVLRDYSQLAGKYKDHVKIGGYKLILDGSPQGKSAWMTTPYENCGDYCGYPRYTDEQVTTFIKEALEDEQQVLAHCNGDAAGDQFLRCYRNAYEEVQNPGKKSLRPVMIHCQTARKDQMQQMKDLNMLPSVFVGHVYYWGDIHIKNFGQERGGQISPCKWAEEEGLVLNLHQDMPVTRPNMLHSIWCAVNRVSRTGKIIGEEQKITVYQAFRAASYGGAYEYNEEDRKGTLESGKKADMIIMDKDPFAMDPMEIKNIEILETIKDGDTVYTKE